MKKLLLITLLCCGSALAAPEAELWPRWQAHDPESTQTLDHVAWDAFLAAYLDTSQDPHRLDYAGVSQADHSGLKQYLQRLQAVPISDYNRAEQLAYWINLYNAATVDLVLDHYPVKSITKIKSGWFSFGPWDKELLEVEGQTLTLNDIEHRILRPIWQDPLIHYAVNCASLGCPDLAGQAYTAANAAQLMEAGARAYVRHPRGARSTEDGLVVSSIYHWFKADFGGDDAGVIRHLARFARTEQKAALLRHTELHDHEYDWALNEK